MHNICLGRRTEESYCNAIGVFELLMLKSNILTVPGCHFTVRDIVLLFRVCVTICVNSRFFLFYFYIVCTSSTIL